MKCVRAVELVQEYEFEIDNALIEEVADALEDYYSYKVSIDPEWFEYHDIFCDINEDDIKEALRSVRNVSDVILIKNKMIRKAVINCIADGEPGYEEIGDVIVDKFEVD